MLTKENFADVLVHLGFTKENNIYTKKIRKCFPQAKKRARGKDRGCIITFSANGGYFAGDVFLDGLLKNNNVTYG